MDTKNRQVFLRIAEQTANYFARKCWWAEAQELKNEAYLSLLEFYAKPPPTFDPDHEASHGYAMRIASRHNSRWCYTMSSPVSAPQSAQRRDKLGEMQRVSTNYMDVTSKYSVGHVFTGNLEFEIAMLEAQSLVPRLHAELRGRLHTIFSAMFPDDETAIAEACVDVLAEDEKSTAAAESHCVPVHTVYRRTERLKTRAITDTTVIKLVGQLREHRGFINDHS